jgi:hypothetical protein
MSVKKRATLKFDPVFIYLPVDVSRCVITPLSRDMMTFAGRISLFAMPAPVSAPSHRVSRAREIERWLRCVGRRAFSPWGMAAVDVFIS